MDMAAADTVAEAAVGMVAEAVGMAVEAAGMVADGTEAMVGMAVVGTAVITTGMEDFGEDRWSTLDITVMAALTIAMDGTILPMITRIPPPTTHTAWWYTEDIL